MENIRLVLVIEECSIDGKKAIKSRLVSNKAISAEDIELMIMDALVSYIGDIE